MKERKKQQTKTDSLDRAASVSVKSLPTLPIDEVADNDTPEQIAANQSSKIRQHSILPPPPLVKDASSRPIAPYVADPTAPLQLDHTNSTSPYPPSFLDYSEISQRIQSATSGKQVSNTRSINNPNVLASSKTKIGDLMDASPHTNLAPSRDISTPKPLEPTIGIDIKTMPDQTDTSWDEEEVSVDQSGPFNVTNSKGVVLVVEDDVVHSRLIQHHLQKIGIESHLAKDGLEATELASKIRPDLIILDVVIPKMNGFQVCEHIRKIEDLDDVPIIFLTSITQESRILEAYDLGADDYMLKPFTPAVLAAKVKKAVLRRKRHKSQAIQSFAPGMLIDGRYEVLSEIGRGGMGTIYLVRHQKLGFTLAVKSINPERPNREKALIRFQREIQALAALQHPNLIRIHDCGEFGNIPYYVMDYIPGGSLYQRLQEEGSLPVMDALEISAKIASGLQCAHEHHILHRDLKTENILFTKDGEPVLTDFGLVLNFADDSKRLTKVDCVVGTPHYMSPEQLTKPNEIDGRSDVFSLGIVLYEMLTGQNPLIQYNRTEVMIKIVTEDIPSPLTINPNIPEVAAHICQRALQRRRTQRYPSALAMTLACQQAIRRL